MLRSIAIFAGAFAVVAIGFFFVWRAQWNPSIGSTAPTPTTAPVLVSLPAKNTAAGNGMGPSSRLWLENWEKGRLVSEFTAAECTPSPKNDGSFDVTKPISKFYMTDGQMVQVNGDTGTVVTDNGGPKTAGGNMFGGTNQTPRNGILHHVHIEIFPSPTAKRSTTQMDTDNIKFDNDTLRIFTDPYTAADGTVVPGDMVPVKVRGDDYEMDGKGLTIRWNGVDGHLQLLEISHGQRLLIKNPSKMSMPGMPPTATPPAPKVAVLNPAKTPVTKLTGDTRLISTGPGAATPAVKPAPAKPPLPYRAIFSDAVKVFEGERQVALADVMTIDFLQGSDSAASTGAAKPVVKPPTVDVSSPTTPPVEPSTLPTPIPAKVATTSPTTKPANQPLTILWTGPLVVRPLDSTPPMMPLVGKQSAVRLVGSPAVLTPEGAEVRAASATYRTPDGAVQLQNSAAFPVVSLVQMKGKVTQVDLKTGSLTYDPKTAIATIISPPEGFGPSLLTLPLANQPKPMTVSWSQQGLIHTVTPTGQTQPTGVDQIALAGKVSVSHPTFTLDSDELHINLAIVPKPHGKPGDTTEQPKLLTAIGNVDCRLISPGKPEQGMQSDKLTIAMEQSAQDKPYPRRVLAVGHVYAHDPDQHLNADQLEVMLLPKLTAPTTKPAASPATRPAAKQPTTDPTTDMASAVEMESMHATSNVHAVMKDKSTADCDDLQVTTTEEGKQLVQLSGDRGATLNNGKGSWLVGSVVHLAPASNVITVDGAGRMHTIESSASSTTKPTTRPATAPTTRPAEPRPVDISWTDSMDVDGNGNTADVVGHVLVHTVDNGGVSTVTGDKAHIDFVDAPKSTTKKSTTQSTDAAAIGMGNKQLKRLTLSGKFHGESVLKDTDGKLLRHAQLFGNRMIYTAADHRAVIPGPGKLMVENHKPDTRTTAASATPGDAGSGQGNLNITWKKQLAYDQTAQVITIDGDTHTHFQQDAAPPKPGSHKANPQTEKDQPMELDASRLVVTLKNDKSDEPGKTKATKPAADAAGPENGKMRLSHLLAVGQVHFSAKAVDFDANSVDYGTAAELAAASPHFARQLSDLHCDPASQVMIAQGSDQQPGETHDADGKASGTFSELIYDLQAQEVLSISGVHGTMRR